MGGGLTTSALSLFYFMGHKIIHFFVTTKQIYQFANFLIFLIFAFKNKIL